MSVGRLDGGDAHPSSPSLPAKTAGDSRGNIAQKQQQQPGATAGENRPRSHKPHPVEKVYRPVSMNMSPKKEKSGSSTASREDQETYAEAVSELAPDDLPCPSGGGDSHEFVAQWTFWDLVAGCFCCPCHTFSACMCTYLYRDPRKDSFDGTGCKGTGKKSCVKCGQTWEEAEGYLVELKQRATTAGPSSSWKAPAAEHPAPPSKAAVASGKGSKESGRVKNKDRLKRGPPQWAIEY